MRIKFFFITGIMGIAVISGIIKGLSPERSGTKKEENPAEKRQGYSGEKAKSY